MIEQELEETPQARFERKKTSLIASLVASLQEDEKIEASKSDEEKKGTNDRSSPLSMYLFHFQDSRVQKF